MMIMEGYENHEGLEKNERDEIFSKAVRAGKRTYFFDVKATRNNDYYLTVTESKKRYDKDGTFHYEKHKIFLYKEDFEKFSDGLTDAISYIKDVLKVEIPEQRVEEPVAVEESINTETFTKVEFEDLAE